MNNLSAPKIDREGLGIPEAGHEDFDTSVTRLIRELATADDFEFSYVWVPAENRRDVTATLIKGKFGKRVNIVLELLEEAKYRKPDSDPRVSHVSEVGGLAADFAIQDAE